MFGVGATEIVIIVLLFLVIFGHSRATSMARDLGRFVNEVRHPIDELKSELLDGEDRDKHHRNS